MSVRKGDRGESKLDVLNDMRLLAQYSLTICKNEKVFPKSSRWIMAQRIVNECLDAMTCIRRANAVFVTNEVEKDYRHSQQMEAHAHIDALLTLIDLAYNAFEIDGKRIEYWTGLCINVDTKLKAWLKAE